MHDTKQFRENAERCERLAHEGPAGNVRKLLLEIAARWRGLVDELEAETEQRQSKKIEPKVGSAF